MPSVDPPSAPRPPASGPGLAWIGAAAIAVTVGVVVWLGAAGRASQLQWAWGIDGGYFLQRVWQGTEDPFAPRSLFWDEAGSGLHGGRHHSPIVSLFVPAMALHPHFHALLAMQAVLLGAGVLPLFALCWRSCRARGSALLLTAAAVSVPGFLATGVGDFRLLAPAMVLVPATVGAAIFGPWPAVFAATALTCGVREELAPLLLCLVPWLVVERARWAGGGWRDHWRAPVWAVALPSVLWQLGTMVRADLLQPGQVMGFAGTDGAPVWMLPVAWGKMLVADLAGQHTGPPRLVLRLLAVGGLACLGMLRRPWSLLGFLVFWMGACLNVGVVNAHQVHYYAPLVGLFMALVPLALGRAPGERARPRWFVPAAACAVLAVHWLAPPLPVSVRDALRDGAQEPAPEWELARRIRPDERVLASGWLLPTIAPRQEIYCTSDLRDSRFALYEHVDVAFLMVGEAFEQEIREAGFVEVARANQGMLLRRPRRGARGSTPAGSWVE
jgi:hypothetical protein